MNTTVVPSPQAKIAPAVAFQQPRADVSRHIERETIVKLLLAGSDLGWITSAATDRAIDAAYNGTFSLSRARRLLCSGAENPNMRRIQFNRLLRSLGN